MDQGVAVCCPEVAIQGGDELDFQIFLSNLKPTMCAKNNRYKPV